MKKSFSILLILTMALTFLFSGNCMAKTKNVKTIKWNKKWKYADKSKIHSSKVKLYLSKQKNKKNIVVCVNPGHGTPGGELKSTLSHPNGTGKYTGGTNGTGAVYSMSISSGTTLASGKSEASVNLKVAKYLKKDLLKAGYDVLLIREDNNSKLDNIARTVYANNNADCHVSIHFDSTSSNKGAFYIGVPNISAYRKMFPVSKHWKQHNKLGSSIIKGMKEKKNKIWGSGYMGLDLTQTSYSTIPSVDVEVGDKATSTSAKNLKKIAKGIAVGINKYWKNK